MLSAIVSGNHKLIVRAHKAQERTVTERSRAQRIIDKSARVRHCRTGGQRLRRLCGLLSEVKQAALRCAAAGLSAVIVLLSALPSFADGDVYRFPASTRPDVFAAQRTLLEVWAVLKNNYVDTSFGGHNWEKELGSALMAAYECTDGEAAYAQINSMIHRLGDPYTRLLPPREYADFNVSSSGEVQGVGLLVAADSSTGRLVVMPLDDGPAARAGIQPGDEVVSIDGHSVHGWDGDRAADSLRGRSGSSVNIRLARRTSAIPGVANRPDPRLLTTYRQVNVKRERLELSPVYSTGLEHDRHKLGYLRLSSFSQKAAPDIKRHLNKLEKNGAEAFILDLRNNPGGLVRSGLDVARIFLDGPTAILNVSGRDLGSPSPLHQEVVLEEGQSETHLPLAVLVNHNSASASEILAGALHDNHRAVVIGDRTYGKGKIQSVFELNDGGALLVTVARYRTPLLSEIDQVGISTDKTCTMTQPERWGMPLTAEGALLLAQQLAVDSCVLTAEEDLEKEIQMPHQLAWHAQTRTWEPAAPLK